MSLGNTERQFTTEQRGLARIVVGLVNSASFDGRTANVLQYHPGEYMYGFGSSYDANRSYQQRLRVLGGYLDQAIQLFPGVNSDNLKGLTNGAPAIWQVLKNYEEPGKTRLEQIAKRNFRRSFPLSETDLELLKLGVEESAKVFIEALGSSQ